MRTGIRFGLILGVNLTRHRKNEENLCWAAMSNTGCGGWLWWMASSNGAWCRQTDITPQNISITSWNPNGVALLMMTCMRHVSCSRGTSLCALDSRATNSLTIGMVHVIYKHWLRALCCKMHGQCTQRRKDTQAEGQQHMIQTTGWTHMMEFECLCSSAESAIFTYVTLFVGACKCWLAGPKM